MQEIEERGVPSSTQRRRWSNSARATRNSASASCSRRRRAARFSVSARAVSISIQALSHAYWRPSEASAFRRWRENKAGVPREPSGAPSARAAAAKRVDRGLLTGSEPRESTKRRRPSTTNRGLSGVERANSRARPGRAAADEARRMRCVSSGQPTARRRAWRLQWQEAAEAGRGRLRADPPRADPPVPAAGEAHLTRGAPGRVRPPPRPAQMSRPGSTPPRRRFAKYQSVTWRSFERGSLGGGVGR